jgi:hypothetical protein
VTGITRWYPGLIKRYPEAAYLHVGTGSGVPRWEAYLGLWPLAETWASSCIAFGISDPGLEPTSAVRSKRQRSVGAAARA